AAVNFQKMAAEWTDYFKEVVVNSYKK
ncbi:MAG: hypothetical protein ACI9FR_001728, partial [Cryomorphaceae bacterium]